MSTVVETRSGRVRGLDLGAVTVWRGIPYAAPPVGARRHRPPGRATDWSGVRDATELPAIAWQSPPPADAPVAPDAPPLPPTSEDCLFLNVTRPAGPAPAEGFPVLVWIHGGGYLTGNPILDADGLAIARHGVIVVSVAYRLGAFGFLQLGALAGPGDETAGNAGLLDQLQALEWVRDNIAGFGGDPGQVTIYGISAGAKSVANLLAVPQSRGLIRRAISASGGGEHVATLDQARALTRRFLDVLGVDEAERLRSVPAADLVAAQEFLATGARATWLWRPVIDGVVLTEVPIVGIENGVAAGISLLVGNNGRESATYAMFEPSAPEQSARVLTELFGPDVAAQIRAGYRTDTPDLDERMVDLAVMSSERYGAPTNRLAEAQARVADVWRYRYDLAAPGIPGVLAGGHGMDQPAVWSAHRWEGAADPSAAGSAALSQAVADFARDGSLDWPRYGTPGRSTMIFDEAPHVEHDPRPGERLAWTGRTWPSGTWWALDDL